MKKRIKALEERVDALEGLAGFYRWHTNNLRRRVTSLECQAEEVERERHNNIFSDEPWQDN